MLTACVRTTGPQFDVSAIERLTPNVSTRADAIAILGPPSAVSLVRGDGPELLQWIGTSATFLGDKGQHVALLFDASGKYIRPTHVFQTR